MLWPHPAAPPPQPPHLGGISLVHFITLGLWAAPCILHFQKLWYSAARCHCAWLLLTNAPAYLLLPCPPLTLTHGHQGPHMLPRTSVLFFLGPQGCCGSNLGFSCGLIGRGGSPPPPQTCYSTLSWSTDVEALSSQIST